MFFEDVANNLLGVSAAKYEIVRTRRQTFIENPNDRALTKVRPALYDPLKVLLRRGSRVFRRQPVLEFFITRLRSGEYLNRKRSTSLFADLIRIEMRDCIPNLFQDSDC